MNKVWWNNYALANHEERQQMFSQLTFLQYDQIRAVIGIEADAKIKKHIIESGIKSYLDDAADYIEELISDA